MKHFLTAVLLTAVCGFAAFAQAPPSGSIRGTIVDQNGDVVTGARVELRESSGGKYLGITVTVTATSREQLDELYRTLSTHPMVKVVL